MCSKATVFILGAGLSALAAFCHATVNRQLIRDVRVFDGEQVLEHRSVLIDAGKITQIGDAELKVSNADVIDGRGRTLLPGLIDAHVHMPDHAENASRQALVLGITTQLDMFTVGERLARVKKIEAEDRPDLADLRTAGIGVTVAGGHPTQMGGPAIPTIAGPDQAQIFVDARIAEGSDYIKVIHDDGSSWSWTTTRVPMLDNATMRAVIQAAHKRGKLAVVHILSEQQAREALLAGADGLAHMFRSEAVSLDFGQFVASHHAFIIPTLSTLYWDCGKSDGPAVLADRHLGPYIYEEWRSRMEIPTPDPTKERLCSGTDQGVRQLIQAHVPILTGTDAPIPGTTYGASLHSELALLVHDGLTPMQALAAATSIPAQSFHLSDRGWVRPGMRADLVLVEGDPTSNILATRNIVAVWKHGVPVQRQEERPGVSH